MKSSTSTQKSLKILACLSNHDRDRQIYEEFESHLRNYSLKSLDNLSGGDDLKKIPKQWLCDADLLLIFLSANLGQSWYYPLLVEHITQHNPRRLAIFARDVILPGYLSELQLTKTINNIPLGTEKNIDTALVSLAQDICKEIDHIVIVRNLECINKKSRFIVELIDYCTKLNQYPEDGLKDCLIPKLSQHIIENNLQEEVNKFLDPFLSLSSSVLNTDEVNSLRALFFAPDKTIELLKEAAKTILNNYSQQLSEKPRWDRASIISYLILSSEQVISKFFDYLQSTASSTTSPSTTKSLLIKVSMDDYGQYYITVWRKLANAQCERLNISEEYNNEDQPVEYKQVSASLNNILKYISEHHQHSSSKELLRIQIFLPYSLLNCRIEHLERQKIFLRSYDRVYEGKEIESIWKQKWEKLRRAGFLFLRDSQEHLLLPQDACYSDEQLDKAVCVISEFESHPHNNISKFIDKGVPAIIWSTTNIPNLANHFYDDNILSKVDRLKEDLKKTFSAHNLFIIWDDPTDLPPDINEYIRINQ